MQLSQPVADHLAALEALSEKKISRGEDVAFLMQIAYSTGREKELEELSFQAKFCVRTAGIMKRIGRNDDGYNRLAAELSASLEKVQSLLGLFLAAVPDDAAENFSRRYLALTPSALENLMVLLYDLSWHKNWHIDHPGESPWQSRTP
jgi:hypothetical protein